MRHLLWLQVKYLQVDFSSVIRTNAKMHTTEKKNCTSIKSQKK